MRRFNPGEIEPKWQKIWRETEIYKTRDKSDKPKSYILDYFPYPSGVAMHMGHVRNYAISDVVARYSRMKGYEVLHPMGWDSFGLPAENFAIQNNISPREAIDKNTQRFKEQFEITGMSYDWSREIDSSDPAYYRWTQWFFLLLHKRGLAYRKKGLQNWCPVDKTVLANEQIVVKDNKKVCERCGTEVTKKELKQWFFKITDYADRLIEDLDTIDWPERIKTMQKNWIGKSVGAEVKFKVDGSKDEIKVFTTRPDTLFGATYMVLAPEHPLVGKLTVESEKPKVEKYVKESASKTELQRKQEEKEKTGVFTGAYAINPVNKEKIPIWIADYVLMGYGTGAIMAVPAHDERDHAFASKYNLEISRVIEGGDLPYSGEGKVISSGKYNGMHSGDMREQIVKDLAKVKQGSEDINYKLRDWLISRQRYWGAPIPIVHCKDCGEVPVPENGLPVELPDMKDFHPSEDGRGPLARVEEWVNTNCPKCKGPAQRETDTMDGFACSSWYFLRFADPHNDKEPFSKELAEYWLPVDRYIGGAEHAVMHLLYARFWTKVMYDEGLVNFNEPFARLNNQGMLQAEDGQKISKRLGNYVDPEELIKEGYGADSLRTTVLFLAPYDQETPWSHQGLAGIYRFLNRVWLLFEELLDPSKQDQSSKKVNSNTKSEIEAQLEVQTHKTIKKVTSDLEELGFNTAISALMELTNSFYKLKKELPINQSEDRWASVLRRLILMLAPFAPHMCEELWEEMGEHDSIHIQPWPVWDDKLVKEDIVTIVVQINGKVRANIEASPGLSQEESVRLAKQDGNVQRYISGKEIQKTVVVPDKIVNFVVKE